MGSRIEGVSQASEMKIQSMLNSVEEQSQSFTFKFESLDKSLSKLKLSLEQQPQHTKDLLKSHQSALQQKQDLFESSLKCET